MRERIKEFAKIYSLYKNTMLIILFYYQEQQWRTLDNSQQHNKINKEKTKKGDKDGRQQKDKQQSSRERQANRQQAFAKIRNDTGSNGQGAFIRRGSVWGLNEQYKEILSKADIPTFNVRQLEKGNIKSAQQFSNTIKNIKKQLGDKGASVSVYSEEDYKDMDLYLSEDGQSGIAVKPNGDIVSVFSNNKAEGGRSAYMLEMAISQGGRQLDCFDVYLVEIYEAHGFKPVAKMKWNDEYIPEGWNKENFKDYNNGEPDVVFMVYDPNNDIEKKKKEAEEKYSKKNEIPYIIDYDMGEDYQHMYKWRSPAEREAIYNNMLERYKNAKSTEELKKVFSNSDKPFLRQMDDLNSLSKEQAQSINAEYSKRYLELIKDENPEEYKKNKKYLEKKYNIKSDASIYIDSLIDTIAYIDAKKKEFKEEDVNRDADGKFAKKNSSKNKSNDNDKKDLDINALKDFGLNQRQIIKLTTKLEDLGIIEYNEDNDTYKIKSSITEGIENNEIKEILGDKFDIIKNSFNSDNNGNEDDIDNEKPKANKTVKDCINSVSKHLQTTATKLYQPHNKQKSLILKDNIDYNKDEVMENLNKYIDNDKVKELSELEDTLMSFTSDPNTRHSSYWNEAKDDIRELIEKSPTLKSAPYRVEIVIEGRNNFEIGKEVNFDIRSFTDFENSLENAKKINKEMERITKKLKEEDEVEEIVIYKIEDEDVNGLDISNLSVYPNQNECLIDGTFIISNVEENKEFGHKVITLKKPKKQIIL